MKELFDVSVGTSAASVSVFENVKRYNVKTVVGRTWQTYSLSMMPLV